MDLRAWLPDGPIGISPHERKIVPLGFKMELESGYEAQIRPRSGLAIKEGITIINAPATLDADFRGEIMVGLINLGNTTFIVEPGARIAQMVIQAIPRVTKVEVESLSETQRGEGGFGSTGTK